ncbi:DUF2894 domain-containing protein [Variovorax soli]|uniref:DUF2894 domain-containing protein n=1 Tax=Variovorax soli TaxID=376815 RepID=UPI00083810DD|nr:DUF2894 domain-containing protein [Variovorax soli]
MSEGDQAGSGEPVAGFDAWRAGIDAGADPIRLHRIEALARRTANLPPGAARRVLEQKLAALMTDCSQAARQDSATDSTAAAAGTRGPLAALAAQLASQTPSHALHARAPSGETELLRHMQQIWSRLSADRRLTQSLAKVPDKAGPLNSHHLVHRALAAMREASPGYFHHFVAQVDALLALDQMMQAAALPAPAPAAASAAPARQRKGARTKAP